MKEDKLSEEEKAARAEAEGPINRAKQAYNDDATPHKVEFLRFLNDNYVPADKRKALPEESVINHKKKFAGWVVRSVTKHVHPTNFVTASNAKKHEMEAISILANKIVNFLKGHGTLASA